LGVVRANVGKNYFENPVGQIKFRLKVFDKNKFAKNLDKNKVVILSLLKLFLSK
jgi:hypothetical protein